MKSVDIELNSRKERQARKPHKNSDSTGSEIRTRDRILIHRCPDQRSYQRGPIAAHKHLYLKR